MNINILKEYKLKGERNIKPRQPIVCGDKICLIFVYDKKGFVESKIQCLDVKSFDLIWEFALNHVINNIFVSSDNTLVAGCMNGLVLNFNLENGAVIWQFKTDESNIGPVSNEYQKKIIFSGIQAKVASSWCIDLQNGNILWKVPNQGHSYIPIIFDGYLYNCIGNNMYCLSLTDGLQIWTQNEPATYMFNPKIFKHFVLVSGYGLVNFYDLKSGGLKIRIETGINSAIREVVAEDDDIFFGDEKGFFYSYKILENKAVLNWKIATEGTIQTVPAIIDENVLVLNDASKLLVIDKIKGIVLNEKKVKGEGNLSGITIYNGKIYFSCGGGTLYECEQK
ncbi:MAG: PQQ-binding-like beta-propeller repeat protein [Microscillaceae bacterium]|nr:PQQ-binding-like beta-propeller repeat protein [Microscillaceae bacterium]